VPTVSEALGAFAARIRGADLPAPVLTKTKVHLLDTVGVALASSSMPFARVTFDAITANAGDGGCTVMGYARKLPAAWAALVNGTFSHGIDYDDTHLESVVHVSCSTAPTCVALAEERHVSGRDFLTALVLGLETAVRLGLAAPVAFHERGFHPTGVCGTFACGIAAGKLLQLNAVQLADALGLCASMAAGSMEFLTDGSWSKRLHAGWAAHGGIVSAQLAAAGFRGPRASLDGRFGLYRSHLGDRGWNLELITRDLGRRWEMLDIAVKPYPCCHFTHAFIDAVAALQQAHGIRADDIARIECLAAAPVMPIVCEPVATKHVPQTDYDAKFSIPYAVASQLVRGDVDLDAFTDAAIREPAVLQLAARVECRAHPEPDFPRVFPGHVRITLRDGRVLEQREPVNRGSAERPLTTEAVRTKFFRNATRAIPPAQADALAAAIERLEDAETILDVTRHCRKNLATDEYR
jgi:2-methylcitrate dehydratase PrpD